MQPGRNHELGKPGVTARLFPSIRTLHTRRPVTVSQSPREAGPLALRPWTLCRGRPGSLFHSPQAELNLGSPAIRSSQVLA
jgi:hypothetical protein